MAGGSKRKEKGCARCAQLERIFREQQRIMEKLQREVRELKERLGLHRENSSIPCGTITGRAIADRGTGHAFDTPTESIGDRHGAGDHD